jgi:transcription antitermination factor NusG
MPAPTSRAPWYALTVKPRHERATARSLDSKGLEQFSPLYRARRRWCDRIKELETELFPGYVFCRFSYEERLLVLKTPGVTSIVGFGGRPVAVDDREIEAIRAVVASGLPVQPWPYLRVGQRVRIEQGCLEGVVGIVLRDRDAFRVLINVEILQRTVAVEIDRSLLTPIEQVA